MKYSLFAVAASAVLAAAGPLNRRALKIEWVTDYYTTTVTVDEYEPTPAVATPAVFVETEVITLTPHTSAPVQVKPTPIPDKPSPPILPPPPKPTVVQPKPQVSKTPVAPPPPPPTTSAAPPPSPSPGNSGSYADKMVEMHNIHRRKHSSPDLKWDQDLVDSATIIGNLCIFEHKMDVNGGGYGQNLAAASTGSGSQVDFGAQAVDKMWYEGEVGSYQNLYQNGPGNTPLSEYGHFTQVVWKSTTSVGCATVKCNAGTIFSMESWFTVCNYKSAGNVIGQFPANVLAPN